MTRLAYQFRVTGVVQGVFFRQSTLRKAKELSLCGFVQNNNDGSVSGYAEGEQRALQQLAEWLQHGPPAATVSQLDWVLVEENLHPADFIIRY